MVVSRAPGSPASLLAGVENARPTITHPVLRFAVYRSECRRSIGAMAPRVQTDRRLLKRFARMIPHATIVEGLKIQNPDAELNADGIVLQEILAPSGLTELGSQSASPVGVDQQYFFDSKEHRWMYARLSIAPDGTPPSISPAKIRQWTMGGLPILYGAMRHGANVIVPLDASHFFAISTMDVGGPNNHLDLATIVTSTHPERGKRASEKVQVETI